MRSPSDPDVHDDPEGGLREEPATDGSNPPASTPRQDAAGGGQDDVVIGQALETNNPGLTKHSQHLDLGDIKVRSLRYNLVQLKY